MLICDSFLCVFLCFLHIVSRLFDVGLNLVHHLPLQETTNIRITFFKTKRSVRDFNSVGFTWASTSMARYWNMSCRSLMLLSSFRISSCRDSISFRACFVALASIRICTPWCKYLLAVMHHIETNKQSWGLRVSSTTWGTSEASCILHTVSTVSTGSTWFFFTCLPSLLSSLSN